MDHYVAACDSSVTGAPLLKGASMFDKKAFQVLKDNNYNIKLAMKKILFPLRTILEENNSEVEDDLYVNSSLNDLIGSNIQEKNEWTSFISQRLETDIQYSELQKIIEAGAKMKVDIPQFIQEKIQTSLKFSKIIKKCLIEKSETTASLEGFLKESENYTIKTEEIQYLDELIRKAKQWELKSEEVAENIVQYKTLQNFYKEGKSLPVKLSNFEKVKEKYHHAQRWQGEFKQTPKHSKTRQQNNSTKKQAATDSRGNLRNLQKLIEDAEKTKFTCHEVESLNLNYEKLFQIENQILMTFEDDSTVKSKELLKEFIHSLDTLKFTTDLYDLIQSKLKFFDWQEKKDYYMSKVFRLKQLKNLYREANSESLTILPEISKFKEEFKKLEKWLELMSGIFYDNEEDESEDEDYSQKDASSHNSKHEKKVSIQNLRQLYEEGNNFELKPEEMDEFLVKCEEVFKLIDECSHACNYDTAFETLSQYKDKIKNYNIQCEEFEAIENQISNVQDWINSYTSFNKLLADLVDNCEMGDDQYSTDERKEVIDSYENFLKNGLTFYENLEGLLNEANSFAKKSTEYQTLQKLKQDAEIFMEEGNKTIDLNSSLSEICLVMKNAKTKCVTKKFYEILIELLRKKSFLKVLYENKGKLTLFQADALLKEATSSIEIEQEHLEYLKGLIHTTKEWIKVSKKIFNNINEKISMTFLEDFIEKGKSLPLETEEFERLISSKTSLETDIEQAKSFLTSTQSFEDLVEFSFKISDIFIDVPEFDLIKKLKIYAEEWKSFANKILNTRKLCILFFKPLTTLENNKSPGYSHVQETKSQIEVAQNNATPFNFASSTNINIINNNYYFDMSNNANKISKKKQKKMTVEGYDNVLNLINNNYTVTPLGSAKKTILPDTISNKSIMDSKINIKKFNSCSYEEQLLLISKTLVLKPEDPEENFCICRRGDDSVNYMIMCDLCSEWFHGKCLDINKADSDKISQFNCILCCRRKDINYFNDKFDYRRIVYSDFANFIAEGNKINVELEEKCELAFVSEKIEKWLKNYNSRLQEINRQDISIKFELEDTLEKELPELYFESQGYPVEIEEANFLLLLLRCFDWFNEAVKLLESKKVAEKHFKKLISIGYSIFNKDKVVFSSKIEEEIFDKFKSTGLTLICKIVNTNDKSNSSMTTTNTKLGKENFLKEIVETILSQLEKEDEISNKDSNKKMEFYTLQILDYFTFCENLEELTENYSLTKLDALKNYCESLKYKTELTENFLENCKNFTEDTIDYYKIIFQNFPLEKQNLKSLKSGIEFYLENFFRTKNI